MVQVKDKQNITNKTKKTEGRAKKQLTKTKKTNSKLKINSGP